MSLEHPNKKQLELLKSVKFPEAEWAKDIVWLKRLDAVSSPAKQLRANKLYDEVIKANRLFSRDEPEFRLISEIDNVWDSQRQVEQNEQ